MKKIIEITQFNGKNKKFSFSFETFSIYKTEDNFNNKYINNINKIIIKKEQNKIFLEIFYNIQKDSTEKLEFCMKNEINNILTFYYIKNILNYNKKIYNLNLYFENYLKYSLKKSRKKEFLINLETYLSNKGSNNIVKEIEKNNFYSKLKNLNENLLNYFNEFNNLPKNEDKINFKESNNFDEIKNKIFDDQNKFNFLYLNKCYEYYENLLKIFLVFKKFEILKIFKINNNCSINNNKNLNKEKILTENKNLKEKLLKILNKNIQIKEKYKKILNEKVNKIYFCYKCNLPLKKTKPEKSNCNYDEECNKKLSLFYCVKCKINYCLNCVPYPIALKCIKNHKFFPIEINNNNNDNNNDNNESNSNKKNLCLICQNEINNFYYCKYCDEKVCYSCSKNLLKVKEYNCYNCNNELNWKKNTYGNCDKCNTKTFNFYYCYCCDYNFCLNCYKIPEKNFCGFKHKIFFSGDLIENEEPENLKEINKNFFLNFNGICSICNNIQSEKEIYYCLKCNLFICNECYNNI